MLNKYNLKPVRTEKSMREATLGRYVFATQIEASKTNIKALVEKIFGVKVTAVQTVKMHGKKYRAGSKGGYKAHPDWKKTIVTLVKGQKIDLFEQAESK